MLNYTLSDFPHWGEEVHLEPLLHSISEEAFAGLTLKIGDIFFRHLSVLDEEFQIAGAYTEALHLTLLLSLVITNQLAH